MASIQSCFRSYDTRKPVIFAHIPKCAGTSFIRLLNRWFRDTYRHPHQDETRDILLPKVDTRFADGSWDPKIKCIHSHFDAGRGYGLPDHYPEIDQYFTIMRDPFDLIVSMYFFAKGRSARGEMWYRGKPLDIREQYADVSAYVRADQPWVENHLPQDMSVDTITDYLARRFVYVGIFEDLQTSVDHLAFVLGKRRCRLPIANQSVYDEEVPETLRAEVYQRYPLAKAFHDAARQVYQLPDFDRDKILPELPASRGKRTRSKKPVKQPWWRRWMRRWQRD